MKHKLTQANIDPYSSEGRSEIYCRFVLENPPDLVLKKNIFTVVVIFYPGVSHRVGRFDHSSHSCNSHVLYSHHLSTKFFFVSNNALFLFIFKSNSTITNVCLSICLSTTKISQNQSSYLTFTTTITTNYPLP